MQVGDMIFYRDNKFNQHRFYEIQSVCLGGVGREGLVELKCLSEKPGEDTDFRIHETTWVPEVLLRNIPTYRKVQ